MTSSYQPPTYGGNPQDMFAKDTVGDTSTTAAKALRDFRNELEIKPVIITSGPNKDKQAAGVMEATIRMHNYAGGLNRVWGTARQPSMFFPYSDLDRFARSSLLTDEMGVVSLPPLIKNDVLSDISQLTGRPFCSVNVFNLFALGGGGGVNNALYRETSNSDPTLISITYTPTTVINNLQTGNIVGAGEKLFVYKNGTACHVLSDLVTGGPTPYGTMHPNTNPGWGHIRSPLNAANPGAETLLIYANGTISTLNCDAGTPIGTAPTIVLSAVPNGGYPIGQWGIKLPGQNLSAYWAIPITLGLTNSVCNVSDNVSTNIIKIIRTNMEGSDAQDVRLPISRILGAKPFGDSFVFWDGKSVWQFTDAPRNLGIFKARYASGASVQNSDIEFQVFDVMVANGDLYVLVVESNIPTNTSNIAIEKYTGATGAWSRQSAAQSGNGSALSVGPYLKGNLFTYFSPGSSSFSAQTSWLHLPIAPLLNIQYRQFVPPAGTIPFYQYNQTAGAAATSGIEYASPGSILSPAMTIEGYEGKPLVLSEVQCLGDIAAGGAVAGQEATWQLDVATETQTGFSFSNQLSTKFTGAGPFRRMVKQYNDNTTWFTRLQTLLTLTQGTGGTGPTYKTPNGLPFLIKLYIFNSPEEVRSPAAVRAGQ